jgi:hypothetical protein
VANKEDYSVEIIPKGRIIPRIGKPAPENLAYMVRKGKRIAVMQYSMNGSVLTIISKTTGIFGADRGIETIHFLGVQQGPEEQKRTIMDELLIRAIQHEKANMFKDLTKNDSPNKTRSHTRFVGKYGIHSGGRITKALKPFIRKR